MELLTQSGTFDTIQASPQPNVAISPYHRKFEKKLPFVAPMSNVPDLPWDMVTVGSNHIYSLSLLLLP